MFHQIFEPKIRDCLESKELKLVFPGPRNSPRRYSRENWNKIQISGWARIFETTTEKGKNAPLRSVLSNAFPNVDIDAVVELNVELATIARLRGGSAHDSATSDEQRAKKTKKLWALVVGCNGAGFLDKFYSAFGLAERG